MIASRHVTLHALRATTAAVVAAGCARPPAPAPATIPAAAAASCTFTNPVVADGADPWVVRRDGHYYFVQSTGRAIHVYRSDTLTRLARNDVRVWTAPDTGWNRDNIWAPELHYLRGKWYIYYAGGSRAARPFLFQRAGVLESVTDDPQGAWVDRGQLYTGDSIATRAANRWAIDLTVEEIGGQLYAVWSGWEGTPSTDSTPQHLYIARMANPWTIATNRVKLASPTARWEKGTRLDLLEGPEFLEHGGRTYLVYSARESWLPDYRLALMRLANPADPTSRSSWEKLGPAFTRTATVYGPGHASFTKSEDGTEDWIAYHVKNDTLPNWKRRVQLQRFTWNADGTPNFGTPVDSGVPLRKPSGECAQ
jgi:GH43 family beta-xylosidase